MQRGGNVVGIVMNNNVMHNMRLTTMLPGVLSLSLVEPKSRILLSVRFFSRASIYCVMRVGYKYGVLLAMTEVAQ